MISSMILSRVSRSVGRRASFCLSSSSATTEHRLLQLPTLASQFESRVFQSPNKFVASHVSLLHHSAFNSFPFGFESTDKKHSNAADESVKPNLNLNGIRELLRQGEQTAYSDSDSQNKSESELQKDHLKSLVRDREAVLKSKQQKVEMLQDKILRAYAEIENVASRAKQQAEYSKKFAIQKNRDDGFIFIVFRKYGIKKFDPINEPFNPNMHNAVFQVPDGSKPPGTVCRVLKSGYILYDRVIRPAEVAMTQEVKEEPADN
ncbi:hypothetical protein ACFE04_005494 [Oxalis oulophora]